MIATLLRAATIGAVAGSRTVTAPCAVSWAAYAGALRLRNTRLFFLGETVSPFVLGALALGELVTDKLPITPSRTVPFQFGARLASGGLCGAAIGLANEELAAGLIGGLAGAAAGTLAGSALRSGLGRVFGKDWPGALIEDSIAITVATAIMKTGGAAPGPRRA